MFRNLLKFSKRLHITVNHSQVASQIFFRMFLVFPFHFSQLVCDAQPYFHTKLTSLMVQFSIFIVTISSANPKQTYKDLQFQKGSPQLGSLGYGGTCIFVKDTHLGRSTNLSSAHDCFFDPSSASLLVMRITNMRRKGSICHSES